MLHRNFNAIILAAGQGKRMLSDIPKVMHKIAGKSMLQHLIDSVNQINIQSIYIVHSCNKEIFGKILDLKNQIIPIHWILQYPPKGTGHAVQKALYMMNDDEAEVLILYGDVPFISCNTLKQLQSIKSKCDISLLTANIVNPDGYGRIIRNQQGKVINIIENDDITTNSSHKHIKEINSGIFITIAGYLKNWLRIITYNNIKNELYLTDIFSIAYQQGYLIHTMYPIDIFEITGINNKSDLIQVERTYQKKQAQNLLKLGILISDPNRFDLRGTLIFGKDVYIDINVIMEGHVFLGNRVKIGAGCILRHVTIEDDVTIYPFSIIENSKINFKSKIGPFARLRPGTQLKERACVGNFVELKNVQLGIQSKVKHLSYLGDAKIGSQVNIGSGTTICNYDGITKHNTCIKDNAFIGANSQLVAPVTIGKGAIVGAGTTITQDVEEKDTVISRIHQFSVSTKKNSKKN